MSKTYGLFQAAPWKETAGKIVMIEQGQQNTAAEETAWESQGYFFVGTIKTTITKESVEQGIGYSAAKDAESLRKRIERIRKLIDQCSR